MKIKELYRDIEKVFLQEKQAQCSELVQQSNRIAIYNLYSKIYPEFTGKYPDTKSILSFIA
jgi:hypothetical protein